jgi:hypothetical protein
MLFHIFCSCSKSKAPDLQSCSEDPTPAEVPDAPSGVESGQVKCHVSYGETPNERYISRYLEEVYEVQRKRDLEEVYELQRKREMPVQQPRCVPEATLVQLVTF